MNLYSSFPTNLKFTISFLAVMMWKWWKENNTKKVYSLIYKHWFCLSVRILSCHTITNMTFVKGWALQNPPGVWINLLNVRRPLSLSHCHCHCCLLLSTKLCCHYYNFYNCHSSAKYNRHKLKANSSISSSSELILLSTFIWKREKAFSLYYWNKIFY